MSAATNTTPATAPASMTPNIRHCRRCGLAYDWRRNTSSTLKMTYCTSLCEAADMGFTIEALLHNGPAAA